MKTQVKLSTTTIGIFLLLISWVQLASCTQEMFEAAKGIVEQQVTDVNDSVSGNAQNYPIVSTNQTKFYNNQNETSAPKSGDVFYGQDACYTKHAPAYTDNGDGTVTDKVSGLMWQQDPGEKMTYDDAVAGAAKCKTGGYTDWRLPSIKELYSLILFSGMDPSSMNESTSTLVPFIDNDVFVFQYGKAEDGDRIIDSQYATTSLYVGDSKFGGGNLMFGVNFADGRIKGYPTGAMPGQSQGKLFYVLYVRGNENYGHNNFVDNGDGTVSDLATGLMWMKTDSEEGMNWEAALNYAENMDYAGYSDWRLPDAKELQSIVDYSRSPSTSNSAAIDPIFDCTSITNEDGETDYPYFWSSTTHSNTSPVPGAYAAYLSFGRALGYFNNEWMDVHGAGAQRSDPKAGNPADYPYGHGPQGDAIRVYNFVRCVRTIN